jgi:hypothetical protein
VDDLGGGQRTRSGLGLGWPPLSFSEGTGIFPIHSFCGRGSRPCSAEMKLCAIFKKQCLLSTFSLSCF